MEVAIIILAVIGAIVVLFALLILSFFLPNPLKKLKRKRYIVSYRPDAYTPLNADSWVYYLTLESKGIFGTSRGEVIVSVPFSDSIRAYHEHWDQLIASKQPVKI